MTNKCQWAVQSSKWTGIASCCFSLPSIWSNIFILNQLILFTHWLELINGQRTREYHSVSSPSSFVFFVLFLLFYLLLLVSWLLSVRLNECLQVACLLLVLSRFPPFPLSIFFLFPLFLSLSLSLSHSNVRWFTSYNWVLRGVLGELDKSLTVGKLMGWTAMDCVARKRTTKPLTSTTNMTNHSWGHKIQTYITYFFEIEFDRKEIE